MVCTLMAQSKQEINVYLYSKSTSSKYIKKCIFSDRTLLYYSVFSLIRYEVYPQQSEQLGMHFSCIDMSHAHVHIAMS